MCAAKKAVKKAAKTDPVAEDKGDTQAKQAEGPPLNPLPLEEVGPRLLVRLQAEYVMKKLKLKERWEDPLGWDFDDLCAVVASTLGKGFMIKGETDLVKKVKKFRSEKTIRQIEELAKPPEDQLNNKGKLKSEFYDLALILGLGTTKFAVQGDPNLSKTGQLSDALSKAFKADHSKVSDRVWERAKRNAVKRYAQHLEKTEERRKRLGPPIPKKQVVKHARSNISLLREVFGQLALDGKVPSIKGHLPKPLVTAAVMRAGQKRMGSKGASS